MTASLNALHHPRAFKEFMGKIKQVAQEQLALHANDHHFVQSRETVIKEALLLNDVAAQLKGCYCDCPENVLAAIFEPAAVELILAKCKNAYWFWYLIDKIETQAFPVTALAVARAHARAKDAMNDRRYGFNFIETVSLPHQLKQLPPGFVLEMWHKGRLLCEGSGFGEFTVILNPLLIDD